MRLSIGASALAKVFGTIVIPVVVAGGVVAADRIARTTAEIEAGGRLVTPPAGLANEAEWVFRTLPLPARVISIAVIVIGLYALIYLWRAAAWLDGSVVTKRGAFFSRRVDLATATVKMGSINYSNTSYSYQGTSTLRTTTFYRVPALVATAPGRAIAVKIPLHGMGLKQLPAHQLAHLAWVIEGNTGPQAEKSRAVGAYLRVLAAAH